MTLSSHRFVSGLAWIMMLWSGYEILTGVAAITIWEPAIASAPVEPSAPSAGARDALSVGPWLVAGLTLFDVAWFVVACGLLGRREWARRWFIGLLVLTIVEVTAMALYVQSVISGVEPTLIDSLPGFSRTLATSTALNVALTLLTVGFLAWLVNVLRSDPVRGQFLRIATTRHRVSL